jgi:hypothetical protein
VLVEDEVEVERHAEQLMQQVGRLLQMGLSAPATPVVQTPGEADDDGLLGQTVHVVVSSS